MDAAHVHKSFNKIGKNFGCNNLENEPLFYQHYSQLMFESLIERKLKESLTDTADEIVPRLTLDKENAVHYVAGYVVRKVRDSL